MSLPVKKPTIISVKVKVKPSARLNLLETLLDGTLKISLTAPARQNQANQAAIKLLAESFQVSPSAVILQSGQHSREKTFLIKK